MNAEPRDVPLVGRVADEEVDLVDEGHPGFGLLLTVGGTSYDARLFAANGGLFQVVGQAPAGSPQMGDHRVRRLVPADLDVSAATPTLGGCPPSESCPSSPRPATSPRRSTS